MPPPRRRATVLGAIGIFQRNTREGLRRLARGDAKQCAGVRPSYRQRRELKRQLVAWRRASSIRVSSRVVFLSRVGEYLARMKPDGSFLDDVRQSLREKLFVSDGCKITEYSGRGPLGGWVRVLAVRTAIDLRRRRGERLPDLQAETPSAVDPELGYLAERYRGEVEQAFRHALAALDGEQRTLLRMHFVDAVTLDELARLRNVHRATIARHLVAARKAVLDEIRRHLRERLAVSSDEFVSLIRLVRSRLQISVVQLLAQ